MGNRRWSVAHGLWSSAGVEFLWLLALTMLGALLRLWMLGSKGLWYDEASTALMARAVPEQILQFHWNAAFEHPPLWILLMHLWSKAFGQGEAALRVPSALAGTLAVPMIWQIARTAWQGRAGRMARLLAAALLATSPVLILYGQEARMYSLAVLLALTSVYLTMRLQAKNRVIHLVGLVLVNWLMLGLHYYSVLLIAIEAVFLLAYALRSRSLAGMMVLAVMLSVLPFLLWAWLAPGFHTTVNVVLRAAGGVEGDWFSFLDAWWRDLSFGSVRWQPPRAAFGYLLLPFLFVGVLQTLRNGEAPGGIESSAPGVRWGILFVLIVVLPLLAGLALAGGMATRYILWMIPFAYLLVALGISTLWRLWQPLGIAGLLVAGLVAGLGLEYYFTTYQKSEYREMASHLRSQALPGDAIILEAPRQHLLAKYYLPSADDLYSMPEIDLPDYWPVTAPPVVPEEADHELQAILEKHGRIWLIITGEDEVDRGEFVEKYLTAISYPTGCRRWLDVRLCSFRFPDDIPLALSTQPKVAFEGGMELRELEIGLDVSGLGDRSVYVSPLWHASVKPGTDFAVTLRLLGLDGVVVSQSDGFPMGPLLPPTAWDAGDSKPGYMVLEVSETVAPGEYDLVIGLYDPASLRLMSFSGEQMRVFDLVKLATIKIDSVTGLSVVK